MKKINRKWRHGKHFVFCLLGIGVIVTLSGYLLSSADSGQKPEWKGTMKTENGVVIVENPAEPLYKNAALILTEELSIGGKDAVGDSELIHISDLDVDSAGNIYVLDGKACVIKVFDKNGRFVRTMGKRGQGPGEFQGIVSIQIIQNEKIVIRDMLASKFIYFSLGGNYLEDRMISESLGRFSFSHYDGRGNVYGDMWIDGDLPRTDLVRMSPDFKSVTVISSIEREASGKKKEINYFLPMFRCCGFGGDKLIWGNNSQYALHVEDSSGRRIRTILKRGKALEMSVKDKNDFVEKSAKILSRLPGFKLVVPDNFPWFEEISVDEVGRIFVSTCEKNVEAGAIYCDVFDSEGRYVAHVPIPTRFIKTSPIISQSRELIWKNGALYTTTYDDEDYPVIKRYGVRWMFR